MDAGTRDRVGVNALPDPAEMRAIADRIAAHAAATRAHADRLGRRVQYTEWHGGAADTFRTASDFVLANLRRSAGRLDAAADALRRHAAQVQEVLDRLQQLTGDLSGLAGDTTDLLHDDVLDPLAVPGDTVSVIGDGADLVGDGIGLVGDALGL